MNLLKTVYYDNLVNTELDWLASFQLENGALPMTPLERNSAVRIVPYFSEFTALAFLVRPEKYIDNAKRYMDWHFKHLNGENQDYNGVDGTIYDYIAKADEGGNCVLEIQQDQQTGHKSYDSTDSYGALFLTLLWQYYLKSGNTQYLLEHKNDISRILKATLSTMRNGLTWAKPDYPIKYLMDNCEVYRGLVCAEKIYDKILIPLTDKDTNEADNLHHELDVIRESLDQIMLKFEKTMWNKKKGYYYSGVTDDEKPIYRRFSWKRFYPDATAQLFPIVMGVIAPDDDKAKLLYSKFNEYYCTGKKGYNWDTLELKSEHIWGAIPYTAALMGDLEKVKRYAESYIEKYVNTGRKYPLYNSDVAMLIFALDTAASFYKT